MDPPRLGHGWTGPKIRPKGGPGSAPGSAGGRPAGPLVALDTPGSAFGLDLRPTSVSGGLGGSAPNWRRMAIE